MCVTVLLKGVTMLLDGVTRRNSVARCKILAFTKFNAFQNFLN